MAGNMYIRFRSAGILDLWWPIRDLGHSYLAILGDKLDLPERYSPDELPDRHLIIDALRQHPDRFKTTGVGLDLETSMSVRLNQAEKWTGIGDGSQYLPYIRCVPAKGESEKLETVSAKRLKKVYSRYGALRYEGPLVTGNVQGPAGTPWS